MAGIYLHIPFCRQACNYCNFHFATSLRYKEEVIEALIKEIDLQKDYLSGEPVGTIYFGGGTPSLLENKDCDRLLEKIQHTFQVDSAAEITLEANPDDVCTEKLEGWKKAGINRLSIGIQSFFEEDLKWMNRAHDARQARQCIELSLAAGFTNMSIDLIYGTPLLTDEMWWQNVETATSYNIAHLSCYALTVEEKTPLQKQILQQKKENVDMDKQARHFLQLMQWAREKGYEHYEVSNFALPGKRSRHNSSYWRGEKYLGLGPSAHSFNGQSRQWNIANNQLYINAVKENRLESEREELTPTQQLNEYIMISLRTKEGLDLNRIGNKWGESTVKKIRSEAEVFLRNGLAIQSNDHISLTDSGMLMADGIASDLFFEEP